MNFANEVRVSCILVPREGAGASGAEMGEGEVNNLGVVVVKVVVSVGTVVVLVLIRFVVAFTDVVSFCVVVFVVLFFVVGAGVVVVGTVVTSDFVSKVFGVI